MATGPELVSIDEAAKRLGISAHAVRRRIRAGTVYAVKEERPQGFAWLVGFEGDVSVPAPLEADVARDGGELAMALALIEKLHAEVIELSGRIGFLQGQLEEIRSLPAPAAESRAAPTSRPRWLAWLPLG